MVPGKNISWFYIFYILIMGMNFNKVYGQTKLVLIPVQTSLVVDCNTGKILHEKNSNIKIYPASLTKLMTLYILFETVESGQLKMKQKLYVSKNAEKMLPAKLGLKEHETITVKEAIAALVIKSANDVAIAVAENIKGSEEKFVKLMNYRAKQLGMKATNFTNASGWHNPAQKSTARDLVKLAIAIKRDFPQYYHVFAENSFTFRGKLVKGHNKINETYYGVEGLKTGYTIPSGYNLITAATRQKKSLVAVVTGGKTAIARNEQMEKLLDTHFGTPAPIIMKRAVAKTSTNSNKLYGSKISNKKVKRTKAVATLKLKNKKN